MPEGITRPAGNPNAFSPDGKSLLLEYQRHTAAIRSLGLRPGFAASLANSAIRPSPASIPTSLPAAQVSALQELRRPNDQCVSLDAVQPEARRFESRR